jgi:cyclopropane-fatty-acyl-phospholipid synthase
VDKEEIAMRLDDADLLKPDRRQAAGISLAECISGASKGQGPLSPDAHLIRLLLASLGNPPIRFTLWTGESAAGMGRSVGGLRIADRSVLLKLLINPERYFGEAYSDGAIEVEGDLVKLAEAVYVARGKPVNSYRGWLNRVAGWIGRGRRNTLSKARDNIHHHYDIGNDFYSLWLDQQMSYTCAYFPAAEITLEQAQIAKMDLVCRKLRLRAGESVVEAGCGWGALAIHIAKRYGARVRAFNISREQVAYARLRARALGVDGRVEFIEDDYRNIGGRHDAFVSVGMLEHVGPGHYNEFGRLIDRCLASNGRGLVHSIGQVQPKALNAWIEKHIFPGAYPPTLREMAAILEPSGFAVVDVENLRLHYALTLAHWLRRFEAECGRVRAMYDERFVRMWRLYLAGSLAAFKTGELQLFQVLFSRASSNDVPWTRAYLYTR